MRQHSATFANFICRFGDEKTLLDYVQEIVIPAFTRDTYVRSYGARTYYHFYNVTLTKLEEEGSGPVFALVGRFVKDTELTRHQIFDADDGLIQDELKMRSAPSAFFVLILNNHRLIYFPETPHAPDFKPFEATAKHFLRRRHREYIDELHRKFLGTSNQLTKKALYQIHPVPTLEVIPMTGRDSIEQFMRRYKLLRRIDFRLVLPNADIDAGEILGQVRGLGTKLKSERTAVSVSSGEGLEIDEAIEAVASATQTGNQDVKLDGVDGDGNKLLGNNDEFRINAPVQDIPSADGDLMGRLYGIYKRLTSRGVIRAPDANGHRDRIQDLERLM